MSELKKNLNEESLEQVQGGFKIDPNGGGDQPQNADHCLGCMKPSCEGCEWFNNNPVPTPKPNPTPIPEPINPVPSPYNPKDPGTYNG